ncbi:sensor histidine kinase [Euzebya sp.]|uniref:sensor histidine kinase n=1 Tax=Euzebya sp. TaxID=1971409 RepID=UPI003518E8CF
MSPPRARTAVAALGAARRVRSSDPAGGTAIIVVVVAAVLVAGVLTGQLAVTPRPSRVVVVLDAVVGLGGALALPLALRQPLAAAVGYVALSAVAPTATPLAGTALLWLATQVPLAASVPAAVAAVAAQVVRQAWRPAEGGLLGWWLVAVAAGYAAVVGWGAWSQAHRQVLVALTERAERAEAEQAARVAEARRAERVRIAREMHDVLAHRLSLLAMVAGAVEYNREASAERLAEAASVIRTGAHQALEELRQVIDVLRAEDGTAADGHTSPPQPTLSDLPALVEDSRRAGAIVELTCSADPDGVPAAAGRAAYRVVQEALTNARKHAPGRPVEVAVAGAEGGSLVVEVVNPVRVDPTGRGGAAVPGSGTGLVGMAERVALAGGDLEVGPVEGSFRVRARLPWSAP